MSNISIRVKLPEAPEEYVVKEERVILWDRILSVAFMGVILLAVIYFVFVFDWSSTEPTKVSGSESFSEQALAKHNFAVTTGDISEPKTDEGIAKTPIIKTEPVSQALTPKAPLSTPETVKITAQSKPAVLPKVEPAEQAVVIAKTQDAFAAESGKTADIRGEVAPIEAPNKLLSVTPAAVNVHSPKVKQALITREMKNRKPGDPLSDVVYVTEGELLTVYFYAEFDGLAKQTLHFDWFQNGKRRARVRIRPLEENIGNYSSKYITHRMTGDWSVSVNTASGEKLASANFKVVN